MDVIDFRPWWEKPLASKPYTSYRIRGPLGYIMCAGMNPDEAMKEAERSSSQLNRADLEVWDSTSQKYVLVAK